MFTLHISDSVFGWETANTRKVHRLYQITSKGSMVSTSLSLSFKVDGVMQGEFIINIKRVGL
jgi:hypothetical protein